MTPAATVACVGSTGVAGLEGERLHLVGLELGEARGHEHLVEAGTEVEVGELPRRAPVEGSGEGRAGHRERDPRPTAEVEADPVAGAAEPAVQRVADGVDLHLRRQEVDQRADRDRELARGQVRPAAGDADATLSRA